VHYEYRFQDSGDLISQTIFTVVTNVYKHVFLLFKRVLNFCRKFLQRFLVCYSDLKTSKNEKKLQCDFKIIFNAVDKRLLHNTRGQRNRPAVVTDDLSEFGLVFAVVRVAEHVFVVAVVRHVTVLGDEVNVQDADVDAQSRLAIPVEVVSLRSVGDVVGGDQVARAVKVLEEHVVRSLDLHPCPRTHRRHRCRVTASTMPSSIIIFAQGLIVVRIMTNIGRNRSCSAPFPPIPTHFHVVRSVVCHIRASALPHLPGQVFKGTLC